MAFIPVPQSQEIPEALYKEFQRMLHSFVWKYAHVPSTTREDLLGEAHLIFCESVRTFDPTNGASFSTYLHSRLRGITHHIEREVRHQECRVVSVSEEGEVTDILDSIGALNHIAPDLEWKDYYTALPPDARCLADWHKDGELDPPTSAKQKLRPLSSWSVFQRKAKKQGWAWDRTQQAWAELSGVLDAFRRSEEVGCGV